MIMRMRTAVVSRLVNLSLHLELRPWVDTEVINHWENEYKSRDIVGSDSSLGP